MVDTDKKDQDKTADLEDTVRNLREENAKLLQLLRSQGLLLDSSLNQNGKSTDSIFPILHQQNDSTNITCDHSDLTLTTQKINGTNQTNHQHINNHVSINQQTFNAQTVHGNQSNITPNFNTVIQTSTQPFVQNSSNTLVQNNTNLIQPINLVNFNNVSLDSIQSFFASQNNVVYLSQQSTSSTTTTTTTTTATPTTTSTSSILSNANLNESVLSSTNNILPSTPPQISSNSEQLDPIPPIRAKLSLLHQNQELVPVITKIRPEHYESFARKFSSSSNNNDSNSFCDSDSNDSSKQKYPRPIRPKLSSRTSSLRVSSSTNMNKTRTSSKINSLPLSSSSSFVNNSSPTVSLFPSSSCVSQSSLSTNFLSQASKLNHSKSLDLSVPTNNTLSTTSLPTTINKKFNKSRVRNKKKANASSAIGQSNSQTLVTLKSSICRTLIPVTANVQCAVASNSSVTKRSTTNKKQLKRNNSKAPIQYQNENILQQDAPSPTSAFAESISGLLENFDQELMASNFLAHATNNLLSNEHNSIISSNTNIIQTTDNIELRCISNGIIQQQETCSTTTASMPTLDEFHNRLGSDTISINQSCNELQTTHDYHADNEHITSFMSEEDMRFVEMNFDENVFLKQFDLEDPGIKSSVYSDQNFFANILTSSNGELLQQSANHQNQSITLSAYSGSSLINNNVFTTVVPLGSQQQAFRRNAFNNNNNNQNSSTISLLPEEGVQLTARHIEPSQVATYESAKYQDILDDLVMVTDQDVLQHVQATAATDSSIESTDLSLVLLEAANELMKTANIQLVDGISSAFAELQYFYPIEQEQANLEKQLEIDQNTEQTTMNNNQQPIVILEKLQSDIIGSTNVSENTLEDSIINTSINDLSSLLQLDQVESLTPNQNRLTTDLITPVRPTKKISHLLALNSPPLSRPLSANTVATRINNNSDNNFNSDIDIDSSLTLPNILDNGSTVSCSVIPDAVAISSTSVRHELQPIEPLTKSNQLLDLISSPTNSSLLSKPSHTEMIIDSGHLDTLDSDTTNFVNSTDDAIEELLRETTDKQLEIIETQGKTVMLESITVDDVDKLVEQIEMSSISNPKLSQSFEKAFLQYQEKYYFNRKKQENLSVQKFKQQVTIPTVKLKLPSQNVFMQEDQSDASSSPKETNEDLTEHVPLKIRIRTKLPSESPSGDKTQDEKIHKAKKKKIHHGHQQNHQKTKSTNEQAETECASIICFETPLLQISHPTSPPTPAETITKDEVSTSPLLTVQQTESDSLSTTVHSGFMIDEQTPPSSITSNEHKLSPPPLLVNQTIDGKLKMNYSHLFDYDNSIEHQNNNAYITPPPEIDNHISQQKSNTYENFCQFSNSPNKKKHHRRKSSVTSSTSSRSLSNLDYAIDTQDLEPVSPTPITTSKKHNSQHQSSSNHRDISPTYGEHQQSKHNKEYYSKKSSSNRSSRMTSSQIYSQSRSLSSHSYRTSQEPPLVPPILPIPPPPPPPMHMDPYAQGYHPFTPRAGPPYLNFPFPHPFLNPHSATSAHFHSHSMKYPHSHPHPRHFHSSHGYSMHAQQHSYHTHLQRQQHYNNSNYMSSRDHRSFDR